MTVDDWSKLIESVAKLCSAIVWPSLAVIIFLSFGPSLRAFFENLSEINISSTGLSAKRTAIVAANLSAANEKAQVDRSGTNQIVDATSEVTANVLRKAATTNILWVDDNPSNNFYER